MTRVAIVHEWIASRAGSEQVFEELARLWPQADLYALTRDPDVAMDFGGRHVRTTMLDVPTLRNRRNVTLPLMPLAWRALRGGGYDVTISSHHAFAASNSLARHGVRLAYVHSPARYVWSPDIDQRGAHWALAPARRALRTFDLGVARRLDGVSANSTEVAKRIARFWKRDARVIHPPVDTEYFGAEHEATLELPERFVVGFGRWIPYKNHEMVLRVADMLGVPAVLAGSGPLEADLRRVAADCSVPVIFVRSPSRPVVRELLARAQVLLFPTHEDFGMIPVEAMAAGTPVVAMARGGAQETVLDGVSGRLVGEQRVAAYAEAVREAADCRPADCRQQAARFGRSRFAAEVTGWVHEYC